MAVRHGDAGRAQRVQRRVCALEDPADKQLTHREQTARGWGQLPKAVGVVAGRQQPDRILSVGDDVAAHNGSYLHGVSHLSTRLGARPAQITVLDELPKNVVDKIAKPSLRQRHAATR